MESFRFQGDTNLNLCSTLCAVFMSPFFSVIYHAIEYNYIIFLYPGYFFSFVFIVDLHLATSDFGNI